MKNIFTHYKIYRCSHNKVMHSCVYQWIFVITSIALPSKQIILNQFNNSSAVNQTSHLWFFFHWCVENNPHFCQIESTEDQQYWFSASLLIHTFLRAITYPPRSIYRPPAELLFYLRFLCSVSAQNHLTCGNTQINIQFCDPDPKCLKNKCSHKVSSNCEQQCQSIHIRCTRVTAFM